MNINSIDESRNSDRTIKFARPTPVRGKNGGKPRGDSIEFSKYPVSLKEIPVYVGFDQGKLYISVSFVLNSKFRTI